MTHIVSDQRLQEFEIRRQNPNVKVIHRTLTQLGRGAADALDAEKKLIM